VAVADQMILRFKNARKVAASSPRPKSDWMPMPDRAAATSRVAIGSTARQPSSVSVHCGARNTGKAKAMSAAK
jgi:hypothetical protein